MRACPPTHAAEGPPRRQQLKPTIAQLVEHLTVEIAGIRWSLARFRVAGFSRPEGWWKNICFFQSTFARALRADRKFDPVAICQQTFP